MDPLDDRLRDDAALDEIELTTELIIAASARQTPLSEAEIDQILGLGPA